MIRTIARICRILLPVAGCLVLLQSAAMPVAQAATVVAGSATITSPNNTTTVINQTSKKVIINWQDFSIPAGSSMIFDQPNSKSIALNRVTGDSISNIFGSLLANGQVWIINPNGILFGKGSQVNVAALIATTSDISNRDFLDGKYNFDGASASPNASVVNQGTINASNGGAVVLAGANVSNEGLVEADLGSVVLAGSTTYSLDFNGDNLIRFTVGAPSNSGNQPTQSLVSNAGKIVAQGGEVLLTANAAKNVVDNVVNNSGVIEATSVSNKDGVIVLDAGAGGAVNDSGTLDASGKGAGQAGGSVTLTGGTVMVADGAKIDVSGDAGGGNVNIGGNAHGNGPLLNADTTTVGQATINADAITSGNGGNVVVWSNGTTTFNGNISARGGARSGNGGFVETSGHNLGVGSAASVDTLASNGTTGTWLLDPDFIYIESGGENATNCASSTCTIDPTTIISSLTTTDVTLEANNDIHVVDSLSYNSSHALSLVASGNIYVNADIQNAGSGAVNLIAGWNQGVISPSTVSSTAGNQLANLFATTANSYGANSGSIFIESSNDPSAGSATGTTSALAYDLTLDGSFGLAQLGYHGAGSGNINVWVVNDLNLYNLALLGNGFAAETGSVSGDINIHAGGDITLDAIDPLISSRAIIGNLSGDSTSSESGNITINVTGALNITAEGEGTNAFIGNGSATQTTGGATGDITITAGDVSISATAASAQAWIGDGFRFHSSGLTGGDIQITATSVTLNANQTADPVAGLSQARIANRGDGSVVGDIDITTTDDITLSSLASNLAAIGNGEGGTGTTSGNITIHSGGSVSITSEDSGESRIAGGAAPNTNIEVTADGDITLTVIGNPVETDQGLQSGQALIGNLSNDSSAGGNITVTSNNGSVILDAEEGGAFALIGHNTTGGASGNITITAANDVSLTADGDGALAQIGHDTGSGNSSGNIEILAGGTLIFLDDNNGTSWLGNTTLGGGIESGNVTVIAVSEDDNGVVDFGQMIQADLGTTASVGSGGNVTVGFTTPNDHDANALAIDRAFSYDSPNNLTIISGTSIGILGGELENAGTGNITLISGWNTNAIAPAAIFHAVETGASLATLFMNTANSYGQTNNSDLNHGSILIGGPDAGCHDDVCVPADSGIGTAGGTTTVLTNNLFVEADNGNAQIGYTADAAGAINVSALGDITIEAVNNNLNAQIGSGGAGSSGNNTTNINVTSGGLISLLAEGISSAAQIGNGGLSSSGSQSGNITVSAANLTMQATGSDANAQIGNGGSFSFGNATGDITVTIQNTITMSANTGTYGAAQIGNGGLFSNEGAIAGLSDTGTVMVSATDIDMEGTGNSSNVSIGNGGSDAGKLATSSASFLFGGNVTVTATHALTMDSTGDSAAVWIGNGGPVSAAGATLSAGSITDTGDITVTVGTSTTPGVFLLEASGASADVQIGNGGFFGANSATAPGGIFESGTIDVEVLGGTTHAGTATLDASGSDSLVQIGNGNPAQATGTASGNITFNVDGSISADANPDPAMAIIGNLIATTGTLGGNVTITAITAEGIGDSLVNDIQGGDVTATFSGNDTINIDTAVTYNSSHTFSLVNGGDIVFAASIQNTGSGDINITSSGNVVIGGQNAIGNVAVGSASGDTTIHAVNLIIEADNGFAQLGFSGDASGNIDIELSGNLTMTGGATNTTGFFAQIGNGGLNAVGSNSGDITINADGTVTLNGGGGTQSYVQIGNGGDLSNAGATSSFSETGDINITATSVALNGGTGTQSYVQIGNGGYMAGANMGNVNAINSGDISVTATAGTVTLHSGTGSDAYTQIGNGGDQVNANAAVGASGTNSGNVTVTSQGNTAAVTLAGGAGTNSYAQIGNGGYANNAPTTAPAGNFTDTGIVTVTDLSLTGGSGTNSYAQIGLGDASRTGVADINGQIIIAAGGPIDLTNGNSAGAPAFVGCATGTGVVTCSTQPPSLNINASTIGLLASLISAPPVNSSVGPGGQNTSTASSGGTLTTGTGGTGPIADMTNQSGGTGESNSASDTAAGELGKSLDPNAKPEVQATTVSLLGGMLHESALGANAKTPHGVPPADQDFSSWGNEGFWQ